MSLRIGCSTGAFFPDASTEEALDRAAELGITEIEVMLQSHGEYDPAFFGLLDGRAKTNGLSVHAIHALHRFHPLFDPYQRRDEEGWEMFEHAIEGAASLGASVLVWHGACQGTRGLTVTSSAVPDAIDRLTGMCARHGIRLALENVAWCAMAQTRDVLAFAARIPELSNENAVGFAFDPFQAADANAKLPS